MHTRHHSTLVLLSLLLTYPHLTRADFQPLPLTPDSYTHDVVVEKTAPPPVVPVTTASMEQGLANSGFTWFERGYIADWPTTGLAEAGSLVTSLLSADHQYQMPPSYETANAVLIDTASSNATVTFTVPTNYVALSFLTSSGLSANVLQYTVFYGERGTETGTLTSPNWYGLGDPVWVCNGRVDVTTFMHADLTTYNPRLYSVDINLTNALGPVTGVDLALMSGKGHTAVFAISGAPAAGGPFEPIPIGGFNADLVVEAGALQPGFLETNTTATMETGTANRRSTWFEKGYYTPAPESGLPAANSVIVSESQPDHRFLLPANYADKNAILLDATCSNAVLILGTPTACSALSFLTASGHGPLTNQCVVRHADGTFETNRFVSPDWLGSEPAALTTHGRVSVSTRLADRVNTQGPRLYAVDVPLALTKSPVTQVALSPLSPDINDHALIFALSGSPVGISPLHPTLSMAANPDGRLTLQSTQPGRLQSCPTLLGADTVWKDEGPIQQSLTIPPPSAEPARFYRVVAP